jgi:hypothetical protein
MMETLSRWCARSFCLELKLNSEISVTHYLYLENVCIRDDKTKGDLYRMYK